MECGIDGENVLVFVRQLQSTNDGGIVPCRGSLRECGCPVDKSAEDRDRENRAQTMGGLFPAEGV